jgi:transaldolase/glucose-6-phosphate isomerase
MTDTDWTGQLFKGGPNTGCFIVLTGDESLDLPVPGAFYTFGVLKHAQALGDIQAMRQKQRRVLHLHLRGDAAQALQQLACAVEA